MAVSYKDIISSNKDIYYENHVGTFKKHNIDKTGVFYHVVTTTRAKERIYYNDVANYRHNLLCQLCVERNIKILFSVTMSNHTHEAFITADWKPLAEVIRIVNMNVSKYISKNYPDKIRKGKKVYTGDVAYIPIRDIGALFYLGMYIYSNPQYLIEEGKSAPHSCFWMLEKNYYPEPYDGNLYKVLFGMTGSELVALYGSMTRKQAYDYSRTHFSTWKEEDTKSMFYK